MIFDPLPVNTNKLAKKLAANILIRQRSIFPRYYPSDTKRRGIVHRLRTLLILNALNTSRFFSADEQKMIQESRLQQLLLYMHKRSPFWREYLKKFGISHPISITRNEIVCLPTISKEEIRSQDPNNTLIREEGDTIHRATTGTTGEPFHTYWSAQDYQQWTPYYLRAIPEDIFYVSMDMLRQRFIMLKGFRPEDWPSNHLTQQWNTEPTTFSHRYILHGNTSELEELATQDNHNPLPFALIFAAAEHLNDRSREKLEKYFKAPVRRYYGMRECGWIAWECGREDNAMHVNTERVILETIEIENGKPVFDSPGEIVVTILDSWRMPRIRYRTGDIGILQSVPCQCGVTLPVIKFIGRTSEFLILPSGKKIPALQIQSAIWNIIMSVKRVQIKQNSSDKISVYLAPQDHTSPLDHMLLAKLKKQLQEILKEKILIKIYVTSEVPEQRGGKHPFFVPILRKN